MSARAAGLSVPGMAHHMWSVLVAVTSVRVPIVVVVLVFGDRLFVTD
jgi:hypothetical protein